MTLLKVPGSFVWVSCLVVSAFGCGTVANPENQGAASNVGVYIGSVGGTPNTIQNNAGSFAGTTGSGGIVVGGVSGQTENAAGSVGSAGVGASGTGAAGKAGKGGKGAAGVAGAAGKKAGTGGAAGTVPNAGNLEKFSFFVTSFKVLQELSSNPQGFGGDLRFGETGAGAGLRGADKICSIIAEKSMPGAASKVWRAFLSATAGENGKQVNAIDRVGEGPWYDRRGRVFALTKTDLLSERPANADPVIKNDFPNEDGIPNKTPDASLGPVDNHDFLTGTNAKGQLYSATATCKDWTTSDGSEANGRPRVGHTWTRGGGGGGGPQSGDDGGMNNWMSALDEAGCAAGYFLPVPGSREDGPPDPEQNFVGSGGGYGGFHCFALAP
jgi:hypothetical protein